MIQTCGVLLKESEGGGVVMRDHCLVSTYRPASDEYRKSSVPIRLPSFGYTEHNFGIRAAVVQHICRLFLCYRLCYRLRCLRAPYIIFHVTFPVTCHKAFHATCHVAIHWATFFIFNDVAFVSCVLFLYNMHLHLWLCACGCVCKCVHMSCVHVRTYHVARVDVRLASYIKVLLGIHFTFKGKHQ